MENTVQEVDSSLTLSAALVLQTLRELRKHVNSVILRLFEKEPSQCELIRKEISILSAELDSVSMCNLIDNNFLLPSPTGLTMSSVDQEIHLSSDFSPLQVVS